MQQQQPLEDNNKFHFLPLGTKVRHAHGGHRGVVRFVGLIPELSSIAAATTKRSAAAHTTTRDESSKFSSPQSTNEEQNLRQHQEIVFAGVEWDEPSGKNDGSVASSGKRYFQCAPSHGSFIRLGLVSEVLEKKEQCLSSTSVMLVEKSLCDVLVDRFASDGDDAERQLEKSPFYRDPSNNNSFPNVKQIDCNASLPLRVVSCSGGNQLTQLFPNLRVVSVTSVLLTSWHDALDIAAALPSIEKLNVSDNLLDPSTFPSPSSSFVRSTSKKTLTSFNASNTAFPAERHFWSLLAMFPSLTELLLCHNRILEFPPALPVSSSSAPEEEEEDGASFSFSSVAETFLNINHLALAHNDIRSLDSLFAATLDAMEQLSNNSNNNNNNNNNNTTSCCDAATTRWTSSKLTILNLSQCRFFVDIVSNTNLKQRLEEKHKTEERPAPAAGNRGFVLFPNLTTLLIRDSGLCSWDKLLSFVSPDSSLGLVKSLTDISMAGLRLLGDDRDAVVSSDDDGKRCCDDGGDVDANNKNSNYNNKNIDPLTLALHRQEGGMDDRDRRRLCIAMLPATVLRINNTAVERTNWFGEMKEASTRPEWRAAKMWAARRFGALILPSSSSSSSSSNENDRASPLVMNARAKEILQEFQAEVEAELVHQDVIKKRGPLLIQNIFECKVVTTFVSTTQLFDLMLTAFRSVIPEDFLDSSSSSQPVTSTSASCCSSDESSGKAMMRDNVISVDIRNTVADLELQLVDLLSLGRRDANNQQPKQGGGGRNNYTLPATHASDFAWSPINVTIKEWRWRERIERDPSNTTVTEHQRKIALRTTVSEKRQAAERLWNAAFPSGSVAMWLVDRELLANHGAVAKEAHIKHLVRPQTPLHTLRLSDGDLIIAAVMT